MSDVHSNSPIWYEFISPHDLWLNKKDWIELHFHVVALTSTETKVATLVPIKSKSCKTSQNSLSMVEMRCIKRARHESEHSYAFHLLREYQFRGKLEYGNELISAMHI